MMLNIFHVFFKEGEDNLVLEIGFWSTGCIFDFVFDYLPQKYLKGKGHEQSRRPCDI